LTGDDSVCISNAGAPPDIDESRLRWDPEVHTMLEIHLKKKNIKLYMEK
jgi:hypothetical protein